VTLDSGSAHLVPEHPDPVDLDLDDVAVLQGDLRWPFTRPLGEGVPIDLSLASRRRDPEWAAALPRCPFVDVDVSATWLLTRLQSELTLLSCRRSGADAPRRGRIATALEAAETPRKLLGGRGRPLLATLAGAGLRIDEALSLQRQHVSTAQGTLTIVRSKTHAGIRVVDIPPALRDELATYLDTSVPKEPTVFVFGTSSGKKDNPSNVRNRLFVTAIDEANKRLAELGIEQLGAVRPHGLRRTYATLRIACGDDPVFVSGQIGHEDVRFTLNVYAQSVKRRERMTKAEQQEYDRAIEWAQWAQMGTSGLDDVLALTPKETRNLA